MDPVTYLIPLLIEAVYPIPVHYAEAPKNSQPPLALLIVNDEERWTFLGSNGNTAQYDVSVYCYGRDYEEVSVMAHAIQDLLDGYTDEVFPLIEPNGWSDERLGRYKILRQLNYIVYFRSPSEGSAFDESFAQLEFA